MCLATAGLAWAERAGGHNMCRAVSSVLLIRFAVSEKRQQSKKAKA